jgi:hypothetical protein
LLLLLVMLGHVLLLWWLRQGLDLLLASLLALLQLVDVGVLPGGPRCTACIPACWSRGKVTVLPAG